MAGRGRRVLVVDGDVAARDLLVRALAREGFLCDVASSGREALEQTARTRYDVVVTELRIREGHGHGLAVRLLGEADPPLLIVATVVREGRLAGDLLLRGVTDVLFKPFDARLAAAKIRALADRRRLQPGDRSLKDAKPPPRADDPEPVSREELEDRLRPSGDRSPFSPTALIVFQMVLSGKFCARQLAEVIQQDVPLALQVVKMATTGLGNPTGRRVVELEEAVVRMGQKRLGELALAASLLAEENHPSAGGMDTRLALRRSLAAGLAVELLLFQAGHGAVHGGLYFSALAHLSGRMILARLFPSRYAAMLRRCVARREPLATQERRVFPWRHAEVLAQLLAGSQVPLPLAAPLKYLDEDWASLAPLEEPARTRAELLKLAVLAGHLAVGRWEPWDLIAFPPNAVLRRIGVESLETVIHDIRTRLARHRGPPADPSSGPGPGPPARRLAYCNLSPDSFDFLAALAPAMRIQLTSIPPGQPSGDAPVLVNALDGTAGKLAAQPAAPQGFQRIILCRADRAEAFQERGTVVPLPASYAALHQMLWQAAEKPDDGPTEHAAEPASCDLLA